MAGSSKIVVGVVVAGLLTAFVLRGNHSLKRESPTWDETMHMDYGLNFLSLGSKVPARDHPYPVVALLTLPLFFHEPAPDQISEIIDLPGTNLKAELRVVEDPRNLWPARQMNLALATLGVALATLWLYRRSGAALAVAFCAIATFDPSWLAHARYITTDVTQGLAFLGGAFALNSFRERPNWRSLTAAGLFGALALASKFSGASLVFAGAVAMVIPGPDSWRQRVINALLAFVIVLILSLLGWALVYQIHALFGIATFKEGLDRIVDGFKQFLSIRSSKRGSFLLGSFYSDGTRAYLPVLLASKTPISLLALAVLGAALPAGRELLSKYMTFFVVLFCYLAVAIISNVNLGHRHLAPFLPVLWLVGAAGLVAVEKTLARGRWLAAALLALLALEGGIVHPHYLAFNNELFGGVDGAHKVAVDSACDWGQDLLLLAWYLKENPPKEGGTVHLAYFGTADPKKYDIDATWIPCRPLGRPKPKGQPAAGCSDIGEIMAISATCLQGAAGGTEQDQCYSWLRNRTPDAILGGSILVFRH